MKSKFTVAVSLLVAALLLTGCVFQNPNITTITVGTSQSEMITDTPSQTTGTTVTDPPTTTTGVPLPPPEPSLDVDALVEELTVSLEGVDAPTPITSEFLHWLCDSYGEEVLLDLETSLKEEGYTRDLWYTLTGNTILVLNDLYSGAAQNDDRIIYLSSGKPGEENKSTTLIFGGDICLADNYLPMEYMAREGKEITDCIDEKLIAEMQAADIACLNNEFTISDRGTPLEHKSYTFRASTKNTALYQTLGIDIVSLANNHAYDFGKDAFLDTLDTLDAYGIASVGAGANLEDAMKPMYYLVNGRKIAYVAASRAEKYMRTVQATATTPGVLWCYDTTLFLETIREAEVNSDFVIAYVHWGTEYSAVLQKVQKQTARDYIDAGVDLIIGAHAHQLQGVEYYKGKAIFYNLGNFWFNSYDIDTGLLKVELLPDGSTVNTFLPALQKDCVTTWQVDTPKGDSILQWIEEHSINVTIDENGVVTEKVD